MIRYVLHVTAKTVCVTAWRADRVTVSDVIPPPPFNVAGLRRHSFHVAPHDGEQLQEPRTNQRERKDSLQTNFLSEFERPDNYSRLDTVVTLLRRINEGSRHTASVIYNCPEALMVMVPLVRPLWSSDFFSMFLTIS